MTESIILAHSLRLLYYNTLMTSLIIEGNDGRQRVAEELHVTLLGNTKEVIEITVNTRLLQVIRCFSNL